MNKKTLAIKARLANKVRTLLYKKRLDQLTSVEKLRLFEEIFEDNKGMHWELNAYKEKRRSKAQLLQTRLAAPQTKSMQKKLRGQKKIQNNPK